MFTDSELMVYITRKLLEIGVLERSLELANLSTTVLETQRAAMQELQKGIVENLQNKKSAGCVARTREFNATSKRLLLQFEVALSLILKDSTEQRMPQLKADVVKVRLHEIEKELSLKMSRGTVNHGSQDRQSRTDQEHREASVSKLDGLLKMVAQNREGLEKNCGPIQVAGAIANINSLTAQEACIVINEQAVREQCEEALGIAHSMITTRFVDKPTFSDKYMPDMDTIRNLPEIPPTARSCASTTWAWTTWAYTGIRWGVVEGYKLAEPMLTQCTSRCRKT